MSQKEDSFGKMISKNFSVSLFVLLAIVALLLLRFLPVGIWPWLENFLVEDLHLSKHIITVLNISLWIIGVLLIVSILLKRKKNIAKDSGE